jgi:hypothetical protein
MGLSLLGCYSAETLEWEIRPRIDEAVQKGGSAGGSARAHHRNFQVSKYRELVKHRHLPTTHLITTI